MDILIIILSILKIIGLILLYALLIIITVTIIILFIPIRYSIYVEQKENNDTIAKVKASYFLRFLSCYYDYHDKNTSFKIKLLGFTVLGNKQKKEKDYYKGKQREGKLTQPEKIEVEEETEELEELEELDKTEENNIKKIFNNINFIIEKVKFLYNYSDRQEIQYLTLQLLKDLLNIAKPKYLKLEGEIGFDSPDTTGYFMALGSIFIFTDYNISLKGNFDRKIFVAVLDTKGKFRIFSFLKVTIKFILKKPIRSLIKQFI